MGRIAHWTCRFCIYRTWRRIFWEARWSHWHCLLPLWTAPAVSCLSLQSSKNYPKNKKWRLLQSRRSTIAFVFYHIIISLMIWLVKKLFGSNRIIIHHISPIFLNNPNRSRIVRHNACDIIAPPNKNLFSIFAEKTKSLHGKSWHTTGCLRLYGQAGMGGAIEQIMPDFCLSAIDMYTKLMYNVYVIELHILKMYCHSGLVRIGTVRWYW